MQSKKMLRSALVLAAFGTTASLALAAGSKTTTVAVSALVESNCVVSTDSTGLNFGVYDPLDGTDKTAETTFGVKCSKNAIYTVGLSAGNGVGATDIARTMSKSGEAAMSYAIYTDSARTTNWGVTTNAPTDTGSGLSTEKTVHVYAKIPKNQYDVGVGNYADIVTATISY